MKRENYDRETLFNIAQKVNKILGSTKIIAITMKEDAEKYILEALQKLEDNQCNCSEEGGND